MPDIYNNPNSRNVFDPARNVFVESTEEGGYFRRITEEALAASPPRGSNCCWAAYRQTQWSWLEAERRNHVSRRRPVRMSCASAAELAHSLDAGGPDGKVNGAASRVCEAPRPLGHRMSCQTRAEGGGRKGANKGSIPLVTFSVVS